MSEEFNNGFNNEFNNAPMYQEPQSNGEGGKGLAIASLILGILGLIFSCCTAYIGIPFGVVGIILGVMHNKKNGKCGMSTAGIICSVVAVVLAVVITILGLIGLSMLGNMDLSSYGL